MRRHTKYKFAGQKEKSGGKFFLFIGLLFLGIAAWFWWDARQGASKLRPVTPPIQGQPTNQFVTKIAVAPTSNPPQQVSRPVSSSSSFPRAVRDAFEAQVALDRTGISSGSIDGAVGSQTHAALRAFQQSMKIAATSELDTQTKSRLLLDRAPVVDYTVTVEDLARLQPLSKTWLGKSQQTALDYETILEFVAELGHAHPNMIRLLNPNVNWTNVAAGTTVKIPDADISIELSKAALVKISLGGKTLEAFDSNSNLLVHFPCSIAARVEKRPVGELHVEKVAPNPNYTFDPAVFPESAEARDLKRKIILPPGPNNPVGVAWISLDKPGYGMHGTPVPEQVGRTESHGCFRLANWNAELLLQLVSIGMPVVVEP